MTTETLTIRIDETGARVVAGNIKEIGKEAGVAGEAVKMLKELIAGLTVGYLVEQTLHLANTMSQLQNRLRTVTSSAEELKDVQKELFEISEQTRSSFEKNIELYARLQINSKDLGVTQGQLFAFIKDLNEAIALSGSSSEEAAQSMKMLTSDMANGTVQGRGLTMVLRELPVVADIIAKGLGRPREELKRMAEQGQITAHDLIFAFQQQRRAIDSAFGNLSPTVEQEFEKIHDALLLIAGVDMGPLTTQLDNIAKKLADPNVQTGLNRLVGGAVGFLGGLAQAAGEIGNLGDRLGAVFANLTGTLDPLDRIEIELKDIDRAINGSWLTKPIDSIFWSKKDLERKRNELLRLKETILAGAPAGFVGPLQEQNEGGGGSHAAPKLGGGVKFTPAPLSPETLKQQQSMLQTLRDTAAQLQYQSQYGDAAADVIERYAAAVSLMKAAATPSLVQQVNDLTESIIRLRKEAATADFARSINQQLGALQAQLVALQKLNPAADAAATALQLFNAQQEATKAGGPGLVDYYRKLTQQVIDAQHALSDQGLVNSLRQEADLIGKTARQREIEINLRQLSATATDEQKQAVASLTGQLYDEQRRQEIFGATFDELLRDTTRSARQLLAGALANPLEDGLDKLPHKFGQLLKQLAAEYASSQIFKLLLGAASSSTGIFGQIGNALLGVGSAASTPAVPHAATGGDFVVTGSGGTDSQLVAIRATPGETVHVRTPEQNAMAEDPTRNMPQIVIQTALPAQLRAEVENIAARVAAAIVGQMATRSARR